MGSSSLPAEVKAFDRLHRVRGWKSRSPYGGRPLRVTVTVVTSGLPTRRRAPVPPAAESSRRRQSRRPTLLQAGAEGFRNCSPSHPNEREGVLHGRQGSEPTRGALEF